MSLIASSTSGAFRSKGLRGSQLQPADSAGPRAAAVTSANVSPATRVTQTRRLAKRGLRLLAIGSLLSSLAASATAQHGSLDGPFELRRGLLLRGLRFFFYPLERLV